MPDEGTYGFTLAFQKKIVAMMLFDKGAFASNMSIIKPEYFDSYVLRDMVAMMIEFFGRYSRVPSEDELLEEIDTLLEANKKLSIDEYLDMVTDVLEIGKAGQFEHARTKSVDFARYQGVKKAVLDAGEKRLKRRDYEGIVSEIRKAVTIGESEQDLGTFLNRDMNERFEMRQTTYNRKVLGIPTGFRQIDYYLGDYDGEGQGGGICPKEVGVIMAPTKRGKTTVAANFGLAPLERGLTVVHYSFESNIRATEEIYDSLISGIKKKLLLKSGEEAKRLFKQWFARPGMGELIIKHSPAGTASAWTIESHLHQLKAQGVNPSLLIVDYLGLMRPADRSVKYEASSGGRYILYGQITLELISLAQRGNYAIWLLHQSTKASKGKSFQEGRLIGTEDAADSQEVMRHVDLVLTLNQSQADLDAVPEMMRIHAAASRMTEQWTVRVKYDKERGRISEIGTEA